MGHAYEPRSGCPINAAIEVFGDRWSLLVLRDIVFADRRYFRELQAGSIEGIASNILADRLKRLVELGLLTREDTRPGQLREHGYELDRGFGQAVARPLAGSRVLTGEQSQLDESLEPVGENI